MKEKLMFETFTEFCDRADEILDCFKMAQEIPSFDLKKYRSYIYDKHKFSENEQRDLLAKDKCWVWLMGCSYEQIDKNDLYSCLGQLVKGR